MVMTPFPGSVYVAYFATPRREVALFALFNVDCKVTN